ncbi:MAG: branched-chain amino acid ABC transporter permease [Syntrophobacterales bacterium]|nr:branched-chain amino acid ABC transporter permease [Syntrophobacterales bacterium]
MGELMLVPQYIVSGITSGSIYALIALGFSLIYNASRIVNFSQGEFVMLGALFTISFSQEQNLPLWIGAIASVLVVTLIGFLLESGPLRRAKSKNHLILVMLTVGASIFIQGTSMLIWGKESKTLPPIGGYDPIRVLNASFIPQTVVIIATATVLLVLLSLLFYRTKIGKAMRAVAEHPEGAALLGVPVKNLVTLSFGLSGALGAIAGILVTPLTTMSYQCGLMLGLKGFAAAVLGGFGSFSGSVLGGILLGLMESLGAGFISSTYKDAIAFLALLGILFWRPTGLFGEAKTYRV